MANTASRAARARWKFSEAVSSLSAGTVVPAAGPIAAKPGRPSRPCRSCCSWPPRLTPGPRRGGRPHLAQHLRRTTTDRFRERPPGDDDLAVDLPVSQRLPLADGLGIPQDLDQRRKRRPRASCTVACLIAMNCVRFTCTTRPRRFQPDGPSGAQALQRSRRVRGRPADTNIQVGGRRACGRGATTNVNEIAGILALKQQDFANRP